jgi:glycine/D-amino acid oxidase-like deaminating enzyme
VLAQVLLWSASTRGATVVSGDTVTEIVTVHDRAVGVRTDTGSRYDADVVVSCAGVDADRILSSAGIELPLVKVPGLVALTGKTTIDLRTILLTPEINVRPAGRGRFKLHSYPADAELRTPSRPGARDHAVTRLERAAASVVPELEGRRLVNPRFGIRPIPPDGLPAVGWVPAIDGLYLVLSHSAAHLAPLLGRMVADEIAGRPESALEPIRAQRLWNSPSGAPVEILDESFREMSIQLARPDAE